MRETFPEKPPLFSAPSLQARAVDGAPEGGVEVYLHLGQNVMVRNQDIIGIFDLDNTTWSFRTRRFLERAEQEGRVVTVGDDLPRSFVLTREGEGPPVVYITQLAPATLQRRAESDGILEV